MRDRREFSPKQKEAIVERARKNGVVHCEGCGLALKPGAWEVDHILAEALRPAADKQKPLTIADGQVLGACCHRGPDGKTAKDVKLAAKARRQYAKANGLKKPAGKLHGAPFPQTAKAARRAEKPSLPPKSLFKPAEERT
jgi:hypothetical protein